MPANLTPEYKKAEAEYKTATTADEKMFALEHMMATIPRHKGTEKLQADIKKRISRLREGEDKSGGKRADLYAVAREGAAQAILLGAPNCGKSSLVRCLTNAKPEVAEYPFTTTRTMPGMMEFEDIKIQLVDMPPIADGILEPFHKNLARSTDLVIVVIDLGANDPAADFISYRDALAAAKIEIVPDVPETVTEYGVKQRPAMILANKYDFDEGDVLLDEFRAKVGGSGFAVVPVSTLTGDGVEDVRRAVFDSLGILRVYSKIPGRPADMASPFILHKGGTVMDLARIVHKDFAESLRYARIWGAEHFDGQMVQRDYQLRDRDILELHML